MCGSLVSCAQDNAGDGHDGGLVVLLEPIDDPPVVGAERETGQGFVQQRLYLVRLRGAVDRDRLGLIGSRGRYVILAPVRLVGSVTAVFVLGVVYSTALSGRAGVVAFILDRRSFTVLVERPCRGSGSGRAVFDHGRLGCLGIAIPEVLRPPPCRDRERRVA